MKIPQALPQFTDKSALFLITGRRAGKILLARDGEVEEIAFFEIPLPHYSDKEGFFESAGHGKIIRSGAMQEIDDKEITKKFLLKIRDSIRDIMKKQRVTDFYLFSPREHELERILPREAREILRTAFVGIYHHLSVLELLMMIEEKEKELLVKPITEEANKILKRKMPNE